MAEDDERVGYGHTPKPTRFKPGTIGNPKGRRRKNTPPAKSGARLRSIAEDLMEQLQDIVTVIEDGHELKISKQRAFINSLMESAIEGETRSIAAVVAFLKSADAQSTAAPGKETSDVDLEDLEILQSYIERERMRRERTEGKPEAEPRPR
jgi:hypothetical protein